MKGWQNCRIFGTGSEIRTRMFYYLWAPQDGDYSAMCSNDYVPAWFKLMSRPTSTLDYPPFRMRCFSNYHFTCTTTKLSCRSHSKNESSYRAHDNYFYTLANSWGLLQRWCSSISGWMAGVQNYPVPTLTIMRWFFFGSLMMTWQQEFLQTRRIETVVIVPRIDDADRPD